MGQKKIENAEIKNKWNKPNNSKYNDLVSSSTHSLITYSLDDYRYSSGISVDSGIRYKIREIDKNSYRCNREFSYNSLDDSVDSSNSVSGRCDSSVMFMGADIFSPIHLGSTLSNHQHTHPTGRTQKSVNFKQNLTEQMSLG